MFGKRKKLPKIPSDLVPYIQIETEAIRDINDKMMAFFDTEDLETRYKIVSSMREEITDGMIDNMAVVMDIVIPDGTLVNRYDDLKRAIATKQKYEQNMRLR